MINKIDIVPDFIRQRGVGLLRVVFTLLSKGVVVGVHPPGLEQLFSGIDNADRVFRGKIFDFCREVSGVGADDDRFPPARRLKDVMATRVDHGSTNKYKTCVGAVRIDLAYRIDYQNVSTVCRCMSIAGYFQSPRR